MELVKGNVLLLRRETALSRLLYRWSSRRTSRRGLGHPTRGTRRAPKFAGGGLFGRGQQSRETRQRNVILSQYLPYSAPTFQ